MTQTLPRVSIGLPVFNGENFLERAMDSILAQTFEDMEVILCDNASTDRTQELCQDYASKDSRVEFHASERNRGAAWNFNRAFHLARGEFFKWAAHDDFLDPTFVESCESALTLNPQLILCHSRSHELDEGGEYRRHLHCPTSIEMETAAERFRGLVLEHHAAVLIFGLIRSSALQKTPLIGGYVGSDWVLLSELGLMGPLLEIPEVLFWRTEHAQTSQVAYPMTERLEWFDTDKSGSLDLPHWRMVLELTRTVRRLDLPVTDKNDCYRTIARYMGERRGNFGEDIFETAKRALRRTRGGAKLVETLKQAYRGNSKAGAEGARVL